MKLLYVILVIDSMLSGKVTSSAGVESYDNMGDCLYAAKQVYEQSQWYDGSPYRKWTYCIPIYGKDK